VDCEACQHSQNALPRAEVALFLFGGSCVVWDEGVVKRVTSLLCVVRTVFFAICPCFVIGYIESIVVPCEVGYGWVGEWCLELFVL